MLSKLHCHLKQPLVVWMNHRSNSLGKGEAQRKLSFHETRHGLIPALWDFSLSCQDCFRHALVVKFTAGKRQCKERAGKMPKRPQRPTKVSSLPLWAQVIAALWMVGVLIWFFADPKIQSWLTMLFADLLGR